MPLLRSFSPSFPSRLLLLDGWTISCAQKPRRRSPTRLQPIRMYSRLADADSKDHLMLVSDLDLTMVDHNDPTHAALLNFNLVWAAEYAHSSRLVYSTGRSMQRYSELLKDAPLLTPEVLILSVGTEIRLGPSLQIDREWEQELNDGWNRDIVVEEAVKIPDLRFQEEPDQGQHKVSFKVDKDKGERTQSFLSQRLLERGLKVKVLYSSGIDLDVLPYIAGKGQALAFLLRKLSREGIAPKNILVCGDSGNDIDLFTVDGVHGVIVSNAQEELIKWYESHCSSAKILLARQRCAAGILEALNHYNFGAPKDVTLSKGSVENDTLPALGLVHREIVEFQLFIEKWLRGQVPHTQEAFRRLSGVICEGAKMISHQGAESSIVESLDVLEQKYGSKQSSEHCIWFDKTHAQTLSEGIFLVMWQTWEQIPGGEKRRYFSTAILVAKAGTPNGLGWLHCHETLSQNA